MTIVTVGVFTFLIPIIIVITLAVYFIYKRYYDRHTNKVLESGETKKRKWIAPWGLTLIVLGAQLVLVAGVMFPLSMFMYVPNQGSQVVEVSDDMPLKFDVSDSVQFVINDSIFDEVTSLTEDGVKVTVYKRINSNDKDYYVFLGETDKDSDEALCIYIDYENNGRNTDCMAGIPDNSNTSKVYFKCEVMAEPDTPGSIRVGIKSGSVYEMTSEELKFDKKVKLDF